MRFLIKKGQHAKKYIFIDCDYRGRLYFEPFVQDFTQYISAKMSNEGKKVNITGLIFDSLFTIKEDMRTFVVEMDGVKTRLQSAYDLAEHLYMNAQKNHEWLYRPHNPRHKADRNEDEGVVTKMTFKGKVAAPNKIKTDLMLKRWVA
jgi:hypothetical protein